MRRGHLVPLLLLAASAPSFAWPPRLLRLFDCLRPAQGGPPPAAAAPPAPARVPGAPALTPGRTLPNLEIAEHPGPLIQCPRGGLPARMITARNATAFPVHIQIARIEPSGYHGSPGAGIVIRVYERDRGAVEPFGLLNAGRVVTLLPGRTYDLVPEGLCGTLTCNAWIPGADTRATFDLAFFRPGAGSSLAGWEPIQYRISTTLRPLVAPLPGVPDEEDLDLGLGLAEATNSPGESQAGLEPLPPPALSRPAGPSFGQDA